MIKYQLFKCPCGCEVTGPGTGSVAEMAAATGFFWMPRYGGASSWLCPTCTAKLLEAARIIASVVGVEQLGEVYLGRFRKMIVEEAGK